ncbi:MAG TPA: type II toxin-antitoxin system VapC family toxin [Terriglobales bacterium]|nr:type II toxin-antitoxin system VapC family toxin [Terriglobales bacterium]
MNYLLDTNACIALINGHPPIVRTRFRKAVGVGTELYVPSVALFELWYGVWKSSRPQANELRVETFLSGPVRVLAFEEEDARAAGSIRASLERTGKPIGAYDLLIAGQALARQLTLVTSNVSEFSRVKDLVFEDWGRP